MKIYTLDSLYDPARLELQQSLIDKWGGKTFDEIVNIKQKPPMQQETFILQHDTFCHKAGTEFQREKGNEKFITTKDPHYGGTYYIGDIQNFPYWFKVKGEKERPTSLNLEQVMEFAIQFAIEYHKTTEKVIPIEERLNSYLDAL